MQSQTVIPSVATALILSACTSLGLQQPSDVRAILSQACVPIEHGLPEKGWDFQSSLMLCPSLMPGSIIKGSSQSARNITWEAKNRSRGIAWLQSDAPVMISVQIHNSITVNDVIAKYGNPDHFSVVNAGTAECRSITTLMYEAVGANYIIELPCNEQAVFSGRTQVTAIELYAPNEYLKTIQYLFSMSDEAVKRERALIQNWKGINELRDELVK